MCAMDATAGPLPTFRSWLADAERAGAEPPHPFTLCTASTDGRPSARVVALKDVSDEGLVVTTALWTRKAQEIAANPYVAAAFWWPALGRQVLITGLASPAEELAADRLFAERPRSHRIQTLASPQGREIESLEPIRADVAALEQDDRAELRRPADWGAFTIRPEAVEFWHEAADRMHDRLMWRRDGNGWTMRRLAP
jgi:pyridoxamine 5'-phosphate oxidase